MHKYYYEIGTTSNLDSYVHRHVYVCWLEGGTGKITLFKTDH